METLQISPKRYQMICRLSDVKIATLCKLYRIELTPDVQVALAKVNPHSIESYIIDNKVRELSSMLGMINNEELYRSEQQLWKKILISISLIHRNRVNLIPLSRQDPRSLTASNLSWFTEQEIHQQIGIINPQHNNYVERKFFPISNRKLSHNRETIVDCEDINNCEVVIGYGYIDSFVCFDLADIIQGMTEREDDDFHNPCYRCTNYDNFSTLRCFTDDEILSLQDTFRTLMINMRDNPELNPRIMEQLDEASIQINAHINRINDIDDRLRERLEEAIRFSLEDRTQLRQWLENIYDFAWYCRRWRGPNYPYPYDESDTESNNFPERNGTEANKGIAEKTYNIQKIWEGMSNQLRRYIEQLPIINYNQGSYRSRENGQLKNILHRTMNGDACIRMQSVPLIVTSYAYIHNISGSFERIDLNRISSII